MSIQQKIDERSRELRAAYSRLVRQTALRDEDEIALADLAMRVRLDAAWIEEDRRVAATNVQLDAQLAATAEELSNTKRLLAAAQSHNKELEKANKLESQLVDLASVDALETVFAAAALSDPGDRQGNLSVIAASLERRAWLSTPRGWFHSDDPKRSDPHATGHSTLSCIAAERKRVLSAFADGIAESVRASAAAWRVEREAEKARREEAAAAERRRQELEAERAKQAEERAAAERELELAKQKLATLRK